MSKTCLVAILTICCSAVFADLPHFALGIGHHAAELKKLGSALGIETVVVMED